MKTAKHTKNVSLIGGADGPTSIFIAGKTKQQPFSVQIKNILYKMKRKRMEKRITANPHTLEEVVKYLQTAYHAVELSTQSRQYAEQYSSLRTSLILQKKPELLGELSEITRPEHSDETSLKNFMEQLNLREERAKTIPEKLFPLDFHIYEITIPKGWMQIGIETTYEIFGISYSGDKKTMKRLKQISKDIHLYYGVSREDMEGHSQRYSSLLTALSS